MEVGSMQNCTCYTMRSLVEASSSDPVPHIASQFAGVHHFTSNGGTYNNIAGNYIVFGETKDLDPDRSSKDSFRVLHTDDVHLKHEIYKGPGYRFYSAQSSGKVVALKVYEGSHAKERCSKAARFYQDRIHPNIPHLTAVSPFASKCSFLVFDGEYEGTVDYILGQILKQGLKQILILGLQTVIGLSSGLDYLQSRKYPFRLIGLEHFVLFSSNGRVIISFDPEELGQSTQPNEQSNEDETDSDKDVLQIFNGLCTKTFDAARKAHYQSEYYILELMIKFIIQSSLDEQMQSTFFDDDEDYISFDDILEDELKLSDTQQNFGATQSAPKSDSKPVLKQRQELIWRPPAHKTIILSEISRDFQYFLNANRSSLEPALSRRRSRYTARTPHRCPGYNRIEITLTPDITRSVIVTHSSPTLHEICPVCREVVKDTEVFNCICGYDNDESIPTVRCSKCFEWHHRPCAHYSDFDPHKFICGNCKRPLHMTTNIMNDGIREGVKESETGPFQSMPTEGVPDFSSRVSPRITVNRTEQSVKVENLRSRVSNWNGDHIDNFGQLLLDDVFIVTKSEVDRVYHVFLFEEAILFFKEGGKRTNLIGTFLKKLAAPSLRTVPEIQETTPLVVKGRVFFSNVIQAVPFPKKSMASTGVLPLYQRYFPLEIWWDGSDYMEFVTLHCLGEDQMRQWETQINDRVEELAISKI